MSEGDPTQFGSMKTDPSIEFDVLELVRLKLVEALIEGGLGLIEAERVALYVMGCARPVSRLLKVMTGPAPAPPEMVLETLTKVLEGAPALEKARRIMLGLEGEEADV